MAAIAFTLPTNLQVIGVGVQAFDRLGLETVIPNYEIVCFRDGATIEALQQGGVTVHALQDIDPTIHTKSVEEIMQTAAFATLLQQQQRRGKSVAILPYKSTPALEAAAQKLKVQLLANPSALRERLENKRYFRELFANLLPLPPWRVVSAHEMAPTQEYYDVLRREFEPMVLQDETLSGGKGTFIVNNYDEYRRAVTFLQSQPGQIVVSQFITGVVASIQGCVTQYGVVASPIQQQIVGDPGVVTTTLPGSEQFGGGQWGGYTPTPQTAADIAAIVATCGTTLQEHTYRGIFGLDLLITPAGKVYVIEMNPRLTGLTPVLTMLQTQQSQLSFLLLHTLELAGIPYTLPTASVPPLVPPTTTAGYLLLHNRQPYPVRLTAPLRSGVHTVNDDHTLTFEYPGYHLQHITKPSQVILPDVPDQRTVIAPGERLVRLLTPDLVVGPDGAITPQWQKIIAHLETQFTAVAV